MVGWALLVAVGAVTWSNTLENAFQYDDFHSIVDNVHIRRLDGMGSFFTDPGTFSVDVDKAMFRPLLVTSFALNHAAGGYAVMGYHAVNIGVHLGCAALVWWLAGLLGGGAVVRGVAGLLFVVHPVCSEPVNYISSRSESLAACFYLLGLCLFLSAERDARRPRPSLPRLGVWLSLAAGLLTKETTITLPAALLVLDGLVLGGGDLGHLRRRLWSHHVPGWLVVAGYLAVVTGSQWLTRSLDRPVREPAAQLLTQTKAVGYYLHLLAVPTRLSVEPQFREQGEWAVTVLLPLLLTGSLATAAVWLWQRRRWTGLFLLAWPVLHMLPTFAMPLNVLVNERRALVPTAALCLGVASLLASPLRRRAGRGLAAVAVVVLATLSWQRNPAWASETALWEDAVAKGPRMARPYLFLGNAHKRAAEHAADPAAARPRWRAAAAAYERAQAEARDLDLELRALNNRGGVHLGLAALSAGDEARVELDRAEELFRAAVARSGTFPDALANLGGCALTRARLAEADSTRRRLLQEGADYLRRVLEVRPNEYKAHANLGVAYQELGDPHAAEAAYRQALSLQPDDGETLKNLGALLYERAGDDVEAGRTDAARGRLLEAQDLVTRALQVHAAAGGGRDLLQAVAERLRSLGAG